MAPISRSFGTLYIDGRPAEPGVQLPQSAENPKIEIGNSDGRFIHWVVVGGLLVSRYDLVVGISWNALVHNALIESREITIDRLPYRIRLLRRGEDVEDLGEFKQYLRALGSPDNTAAPRKRVLSLIHISSRLAVMMQVFPSWSRIIRTRLPTRSFNAGLMLSLIHI